MVNLNRHIHKNKSSKLEAIRIAGAGIWIFTITAYRLRNRSLWKSASRKPREKGAPRNHQICRRSRC